MAATTLHGPVGVRGALGRHLGHSDWLTITQVHIDRFAAATSLDERSDADSGAAATVPDFFVLSLSNLFLPQIVEVQGFAMGVNYGTGSIRFPAPAATGSRLRGGAELIEVAPVPGGLQTTIRSTSEIEDGNGPAAVIDSLSRWLD
jgi:acyl dehydratase